MFPNCRHTMHRRDKLSVIEYFCPVVAGQAHIARISHVDHTDFA
jgi:hypothetical protein